MPSTHHTDPLAVGPVPDQVRVGDEVITIARAWPRGPRDGAELVLAEGRDSAGRLRAVRLRLSPSDGGVAGFDVTPFGQDPRLPDLAAVARDGTLVVHRYGRRAVIRRAGDYVKVVRPGAAPRIAEQARRGHAAALAAGFQAPTVGAVGQGVVSFGILPGRSLHELGGTRATTEWTRWWQLWTDRWPALAASDNTDGLQEHTPHDEGLVLRRWLGHATRLRALPDDLLAGVAERVEDVCGSLREGTAQRFVVSHRDLHDKQILADGESLGLLDFDTAALAEPALDLANLWVHAALRADQGLWSRRHAEVVKHAIGQVAADLGVAAERFDTYAQATRLRLTCLYAFRPIHRRLALDWARRLAVTESTVAAPGAELHTVQK